MTSSTPDRDWLSAGRVGRPHGLDGSFHVVDPSPGLLSLGVVVRVGAEELPITRCAGTEQRPIVRLEGFADRDAAERLRGSELLVARAQAPELGPDEWWAEDLVGCAVCAEEREVGRVVGLTGLPSCEVLEVERSTAREAGVLLVPLVVDAVRDVDLEQRRIEIDLRFLGLSEEG